MELIQIVERGTGEAHAGGKAPLDVSEIAARRGFRRLTVLRRTSKRAWMRRCFAVLWTVQSVFCSMKVPRGSVVLAQFPSVYLKGRLGYWFLSLLAKRRRARIVTVVHDVDLLRFGTEDAVAGDFASRIMALSDALVVHNQRMADWFAGRGFPRGRLIPLGIFDYLTDSGSGCDAAERAEAGDFRRVIVAGNLRVGKAGYLARLKEVSDVHWLLYGPSYDAERCGGGNVEYMGCHPADELPARLDGGFGLVWDGDSVETCAGGYGEYLRYNSPHKLSLYLASGIPVVIWKEAAEADLVVREGVGLPVASLRDVGAAMRGISAGDYAAMRRRARVFGRRLRNGEFIGAALERACRMMMELT